MRKFYFLALLMLSFWMSSSMAFVPQNTKTDPIITWANPENITAGTALSAIQLNATADVAGTFVYNPAADAVLTVGTHDLTCIFTPDDTESYTVAYDTVSIVVEKAPMQLVFTTTDANQSIALPLSSSLLEGTVDCVVDWGDGADSDTIKTAGAKAHTFENAGTYTVSIFGSLDYFACFDAKWTGVEYLTEVVSFGDIGLKSLQYAFCDADNLTSVPTELPATITDLDYVFAQINQTTITNLDKWDVSHVSSMAKMFYYASAFNQDISAWDVSSVTDMRAMFFANQAFNQNIGAWDVSKVENMADMFVYAVAFNQGIGNWNVSQVTDMAGMFQGAFSFNQDIGNWDVSSVTNMRYMFAGDAYDMAGGATNAFNQNIDNWDVSKVTDMSYMFKLSVFNQDIGNWDVSRVTSMSSMFSDAIKFNQDISAWSTENVMDMSYMFARYQNVLMAFDQNLGGWNITSVTTMEDMFYGDSLSIDNYDSTLIGWAAQSVQSGVLFNAGSSQYSLYTASSAHCLLENNTNNWTITDGGRKVLAPVMPATNIIFNSINAENISFSWTPGGGSNCAVFMSEASSGTASPVDGTTYTADETFGSGDQIGSTGWYCVFIGEESYDDAVVFGLSAETQYRVHVCMYNISESGKLYLSDAAEGNPANVTTVATPVTPDSIAVTGITSPLAANGTYAKGDDINGAPSWNYISADDTCYIYYFIFEGDGYWMIDDDSIMDGELLFAIESFDVLPPTSEYGPFNGTGTPALAYLYAQPDEDAPTITGITSPEAANGTYTQGEDINGKPSWSNGTCYVYNAGAVWVIDDNTTLEDGPLFFITSNADLPPVDGYTSDNGNGEPQLSGFTAVPTITWENPATIEVGTALSATQLNATADVAGTFVYTPAAGTVLERGNNQALTVIFTPDNTDQYEVAYDTVYVDVDQATAVVNAVEVAFSVYPNPARDGFYVSHSGAVSARMMVNLIDASGRVLRSASLSSGAYLSVEDLNAGMYFVRMQSEGQSAIKKIMIK